MPLAGFEDPCDALRSRFGRLESGVATYRERILKEVPKEKQISALRLVDEALDYMKKAKKALEEDDCDAAMQYGAGIRDSLQRSTEITGMKMQPGPGQGPKGQGAGPPANKELCDKAHEILRWVSGTFPDFASSALKSGGEKNQAEISRQLDRARESMEQGSKALEGADCARAHELAGQLEKSLQEIVKLSGAALPPRR